jgi:uncharacterized protein
MTDAGGGFFSAEDADSAIDAAHPEVKGEGAFYVWEADEVETLIGEPAAAWFSYRYGVAEGGNVASDPHGELAGRNILYRAHTVEETAEDFSRPVEEVRAGLEEAERRLLEARSARVRPHRDDKVLTAWNGLMISAFARGGAVLDEPRYGEAARRAAEFLSTRMVDASASTMVRRYRQGEASIPAFLEDYAAFTEGLLDLYEAQFDRKWLDLAIRLAEKTQELFEDRAQGGFFDAPGDGVPVMRTKADYDGAEPSGNSIALMNLLRLGEITNRTDFREAAERTLAAFATRLAAAPVTLPRMLAACEFRLGERRQIVLVGERGAGDTRALLRVIEGCFVPNRVVLLVDTPEARQALAAGIPAIESMDRVDGRAAAYVCREYACQLPVSGAEELAKLLQY